MNISEVVRKIANERNLPEKQVWEAMRLYG